LVYLLNSWDCSSVQEAEDVEKRL
jgi:hypothetical protein